MARLRELFKLFEQKTGLMMGCSTSNRAQASRSSSAARAA